ncbi:MAG: hypothetical protein ACRCZF_03220 [Gemmataceae bacterium]
MTRSIWTIIGLLVVPAGATAFGWGYRNCTPPVSYAYTVPAEPVILPAYVPMMPSYPVYNSYPVCPPVVITPMAPPRVLAPSPTTAPAAMPAPVPEAPKPEKKAEVKPAEFNENAPIGGEPRPLPLTKPMPMPERTEPSTLIPKLNLPETPQVNSPKPETPKPAPAPLQTPMPKVPLVGDTGLPMMPLPSPSPTPLPTTPKPEAKPTEFKPAGDLVIPAMPAMPTIPAPSPNTAVAPMAPGELQPIVLPPIPAPGGKSESKYRPDGLTIRPRVVPVAGTGPTETEGRYRVGFFNFTDAELEITIAGQVQKLPAQSRVNAIVPARFDWTLGGKSTTTVIPAETGGVEVLLK